MWGVMSFTEDLRQLLQTRLVELEREASLVRNALQALGGSVPTSSTTSASTTLASKPRATRTRRRRTQRTEVVPAGKLEKLLAQTDRISTANLAKQADAASDQVLTLLRELEAAGKVKRTGERRGTRWHMITDEERIQERAAELASRSKKTSPVSPDTGGPS